MKFIRIKGSHVLSKDAVVANRFPYVRDDGTVSSRYETVYVAGVVIKYKDFDSDDILEVVDSTASNREVVKMLYKSNKGIYYKGAGGYWTQQKRNITYLTDDEVEDLDAVMKFWNGEEL